MTSSPEPLRVFDVARLGAALGALIGTIDGALAIRASDSLVDRAGTIAVAVAIDGLVLALSFALLFGLTGALRRTPPGQSFAFCIQRVVRVSIGLCAVASVAILAYGAARGRPPAPLAQASGAANRPNILLISVDTLRTDHLSSYGYKRDTSPALSQLASEGVLFEDAYSHSSWTLPAHASLLTGLDPLAHGVMTREDRIQSYHLTLAERLAQYGYSTAAWVGTEDWGFVGSNYGFDEGFSRFDHYPHPKRFRASLLARAVDRLVFEGPHRGVGNAREEIDSALRWINAQGEAPFFAFLHFYDVHSKSAALPYEAPPPFFDKFCPGQLDNYDFCIEDVCASDRLVEIVRGQKSFLSPNEIELTQCLYDGGIGFMDAQLGRLFERLKEINRYEETIIIVTSDHGEAFFDHGFPLHVSLHEEITHIPLIIRAPGILKGKRARGIVRQSDIAPTLLELVDSTPHNGFQGQSLLNVLRQQGAAEDRVAIAFDEALGAQLIREGTHAFIQYPEDGSLAGRPTEELFNLKRDPFQRQNHARARPKFAARMSQRMQDMHRRSLTLHEAVATAESTSEPVTISEEARAGLRALGYIDDEGENE